jgi:hypothetical protein
MRQAGIIAVLLLAVATAAAASASARRSAVPSATRCGGPQWRLATLSDSGRNRVRLTADSTTLDAIVRRGAPRPTPILRRTAFQRQVWEVVSQIVAYRLEPAGLRLVLFDDGRYINAVIPSPDCLPKTTRTRSALTSVYRRFAASCGNGSPDWQPLGAVAYVSGVGFWSSRSQPDRGAAPNGAQLRPVTGLRMVAGCGS